MLYEVLQKTDSVHESTYFGFTIASKCKYVKWYLHASGVVVVVVVVVGVVANEHTQQN